MGDSESAVPASKKRVSERQISKENPEIDDDGPEQEMGTFRRASDEILAQRRIVKVRRAQPSAATSNPFASLRMVPPSNNPSAEPETKDGLDKKEGKSEKSEAEETEGGSVDDGRNGVEDKIPEKVAQETDVLTSKDDDKVEGGAVKEEVEPIEAAKDVGNGEKGADGEAGEDTVKEDVKETEKKPFGEETGNGSVQEGETVKEVENDSKDADSVKPVASLSSFQQLSSSQNAFTGFVGTGFGTSSFSFGSVAKEGQTFGTSSGSVFGFRSENSSFPSFGVGNSNGNLSWQTSGSSASDAIKSGKPSLPEVPTETGEENEKAVFTADAILYEYLDGGWKERGKGELKLNTSLSGAERARLIMRARGNYRLILNASLYPDITLASMDKKGISFACVNSAGEGKDGLATFALKFKDSSFVEEFRTAVAAHRGTKATVLKTPENSPKASDD